LLLLCFCLDLTLVILSLHFGSFELHGHDITLTTSVARQKHASALAFDTSHRIKDCNKSAHFIITEYRSACVEDSRVVQGVLNRGRLRTTLLTIRHNGEGRLVAQSDTMHKLSQNRLLFDLVKIVEMDTCRDFTYCIYIQNQNSS